MLIPGNSCSPRSWYEHWGPDPWYPQEHHHCGPSSTANWALCVPSHHLYHLLPAYELIPATSPAAFYSHWSSFPVNHSEGIGIRYKLWMNNYESCEIFFLNFITTWLFDTRIYYAKWLTLKGIFSWFPRVLSDQKLTLKQSKRWSSCSGEKSHASFARRSWTFLTIASCFPAYILGNKKQFISFKQKS